MRTRMFVFALVMAAVLAVPTPARPASSTWSAPIWSSELNGGPWGLTTDAHGAVVTTDAGRVRALGFDGTTQWESKVDGTQNGYPAITHDLVLVGATGRVVALGRRDGAIRWEQPMDGAVGSVALAGRFAIAGDTGGTLRAFAADTGALAWSVHEAGELWSAPQVDVAASVVVAIWHEQPAPAARAFDLTTGALGWEHPVGLYTAAPGLDHGRAIVATGDGHFHAWMAAFGLDAGESDWAVTMPASFQTGVVPASDGRDLVVVDRIGRVTAFDPVAGTLHWTRPLNRHVIDSQVVLLRRRVVVTTLPGELFVLDRVSGRVIAHATGRDFDGIPVLAAPTRRPDRMVVALRLTEPGRVEMRRVP
jgi:outer membrane protein assembly factor BamB